MTFLRHSSLLYALGALTYFTQAQDIQCSNDDRSSVIPDSLFSSAKVAETILPALRDTICPFDEDSFCGTDGMCTFSTFLNNGNNEAVMATINKTQVAGPGQNAQLGPCNDVMDKIFSQCITGDNPKSSGSSTNENVFYSIAFAPAPAILSGEDLDNEFVAQTGIEDFQDAVPQEFQSLLTATTDAPAQPTQTSDPNPQCQQDCLDMRGTVTSKSDGDGNICTGEPTNFFDQGKSPDGNVDWFRITSNNNCFIVVAKSGIDRGNSGQYCFKVTDLNNFIGSAAGGCAEDNSFFANISAEALPSQAFDSGTGMACLTDGNNFQKCGQGIV